MSRWSRDDLAVTGPEPLGLAYPEVDAAKRRELQQVRGALSRQNGGRGGKKKR